MGRFILALDQGTTSSRTLLFDEAGQVRAVAQQEFGQHYPRPGWVEHDPREIWSSQLATLAEATSRAGVRPREIAAIGITNQRETVLLWDRATGQPLHNAIVWQDRRTADACAQLEAEGHGAMVTQKTGLRLDPYFSGSKLAWLLDHVEGARERAARGELAAGTIDSWLLWKLTDGRVHATDVSNASRTLLFNIETMAWDDELLELFDIPRELLPEVRSSSEVYGHVSPEILPGELPIAGIAGDQQAALFGHSATEPGDAKQSYGTGGFLVLNTGGEIKRSEHALLTTVAWQLAGETSYALEGSIYIMGAVVQWLRDGLGIIRDSSEIEALATSVEDNGGVYLVPAFTGLGAPHWDPQARGAMLGITRGTTRAHIARAALEAMAFQTVDVLEAMAADTGLATEELRVDGGATANDTLMQLQADLAGTSLLRPEMLEATAFGAAALAGLATGVWESVEQIRSLGGEDRRFEPAMDDAQRQRLLEGWRRAVERAKRWAQD